MEIRTDSLDFSSPLRGDGPRTASKTLVFPRAVTTAVAGLSGYLAEYSGHDDHHVGRLDLRVDTTVDDNTVTVDGRFGVRDWSGTWDDAYDGQLDFVVVAELEPAGTTPPRGDLAIAGVEFNQATQFFRAGGYLDAGTAQPDNSIFLVEGKATGVRVFADHDAAAGLAPIARLGGELTVSNGSSTVTLTPINPGGTIVPRADAEINQAVADDTLNFMIPGALSAGTVSISCRVFDAAAPSQHSGTFRRTLVFTPVEPMNMFLVGIATQSPAAAAPSQPDVAAALSLLKKTYPKGLVQATGFTTATLASAIAGLNPGSGCGQGWVDLLDILRDLRGGSPDIFFGGLPAGIFQAGVVGCSPVGERIAASFIDIEATVPHEVGHSLGREHAPCRGCSPPAQDPDGSFPQYGSFNSDSIGVFGFDPATNEVFNPASSLDFMTAFVPGSAWVSPYTYGALAGAIEGTSAAGGQTYLGGERMTLFLRARIDRDRSVTRECSFVHPAPLQGGGCCESGFRYELLDGDGRVLACGALRCPCSESGCGCWPKRIRDALPFPDGARTLCLFEGDTELHREQIPDPPKVRIVGQERTKDGVCLKWESEAGEDACTVVHVQQPGRKSFRGLAPRFRGNSATIPKELLAGGRLHVRVLVSSGIATGVAATVVELEDAPPREVTVELIGVGPDGSVPHVVSVLATDATGRELPAELISWYDQAGRLLARGAQLDLRALPEGKRRVRAVVRGHGGRTAAMSWLLERGAAGGRLHARIPDPPRQSSGVPHDHPHPKPDCPGELGE